MPGSAVNGALLDSAATGLIRNNRNAPQNGRYVFAVRNGTPPADGRVSGTVRGPSGEAIASALVQACRTGAGAAGCVRVRSDSLGAYTVVGLADGSYTVTAFPPLSSLLSQGSIGPLTITSTSRLTGQDVRLIRPVAPAPGTTIAPSTRNGQGIPSVHWQSPLTLTTRGCPNGTATYAIRQGATVLASGPMPEDEAGTYMVRLAPLAPASGLAEVVVTIDCPGDDPNQTRTFNVYINPSGTVWSVTGVPIMGATVTLYRSDSRDGPFVQVPTGSDVMMPVNRNNPDTTSAAGRFGWEVVVGYYKVRAERDGCVDPANPARGYVESAVLDVPPQVGGLDLRLECADGPPEGG